MIYYVPVKDFVEIYYEYVRQTSMVKDKKVAPLVVIGDDIKVDPEKYSEFFNSLIHLFRNSIDHGLENSYERSTKGKSEKGIIRLHFSRSEQSFQLVYNDDGKGIDINLIKLKLVQKNGFSQEAVDRLSDTELMNFIFEPSFTTAEVLTDLSGRGVGMSYVKKIVEKIGGQIFVDSVKDKGISFKFIFREV